MKHNISRRMFALQSGAGLFALGAFRGTAAPNAVPDPLSKKFLEQLPKMMEFAGVPGVAIIAVENGRVTWKGNFGVTNSDTKAPVTDGTVFPAASLSKPVFAYAVLSLRDEGLLDLDRPLINYLPGDYVPNDPRARSITARHALSHSTGLQNWRFQAGQQLQLAFAPGERFSYSGEGFFYLQRVVEKITGLGLEQFMRERVFSPFGMSNSSYVWLPSYKTALTFGHNNRGQSPGPTFVAGQSTKLLEISDQIKKPLETWRIEDYERALPQIDPNMPVYPNFLAMNSAGSLLTTASDYSKFIMRFVNEPTDKYSLKSSTVDEMIKPTVRINDALSWGLGFGLENAGTRSYFWHWGDNGNFKTFVIGNRAAKWGLAIFTNARNGNRIWERIVREATGYDHASFLWA